MSVQSLNDAGTSIVAATAVASPIWLQAVEGVSTVAEWALPVLGAVWLVIQIIFKLKEMNRGRDED